VEQEATAGLRLTREETSFKSKLSEGKGRVRGALEAPLNKGLELERNLFMDLCGSEAIERMNTYENMRITDPSEMLKI
jgi:hypothetical protein